jgi:alkaline phosphatase D
VWTFTLTAALAADLTLVFGSCAHQAKPQPIWRAIAREAPDAVVLLGDNVYVDSDDPVAFPAAYDRLARKPGFRRLRAKAPVYAVWDDHDYGLNDAGSSWPLKEVARTQFLEAFGAGPDDPRHHQQGVYGAWTLSDSPRVQLVLLDTRWDRSDLAVGPIDAAAGTGPYLPRDHAGARMLGEAQWAWLSAVLAQPADLRIIGSSIPVLPYFTGWETWSNLPGEQQRLLDLLGDAGGAVVLSGDTHWGELSRRDAGLPYPLWELTSSGLTQVWRRIPDNLFRHADRTMAGRNYGRLVVTDDALTLSLHDVRGRELWTDTIPLATLHPE